MAYRMCLFWRYANVANVYSCLPKVADGSTQSTDLVANDTEVRKRPDHVSPNICRCAVNLCRNIRPRWPTFCKSRRPTGHEHRDLGRVPAAIHPHV
ncbi:hypothetical protein BC628DRAFT_1382385 [Trametes gibbosa]|nr:hypothetical protein BC628DRAFT_1382385 [Trametes gibbosa]